MFVLRKVLALGILLNGLITREITRDFYNPKFYEKVY